MEWFRWYHGATSDPKWPLIARKAGVNIGVVVSVWAALLEHASQDEERGSVADFDGETFDALYGYDDGTCAAVVDAMREKGVICDGCICAWQKRQVQDEGAAERKRLQREREKIREEMAQLEALRHELSQLKQDVGINVTEGHGASPAVTECHLEQNREDKNIRTPLTPHGGESESVAPVDVPPAREEPKDDPKPKSERQRFVRPTPDEVGTYCQERQNGIDGQEFCDFYEARGWVVGKSPMKDWKAAVRTWENSRKSGNARASPLPCKSWAEQRADKIEADFLAGRI